jgi:hypothetical protein
MHRLLILEAFCGPTPSQPKTPCVAVSVTNSGGFIEKPIASRTAQGCDDGNDRLRR